MLTIPVVYYLFEAKRKVIATLIAIIMCIEPVINMVEFVKPMTVSYPFLEANDYQIAKEFSAISKPSDIVLTPARRNNWVPLLAGRKILLGARQLAHSIGLPWEQLNKDSRDIYIGSPQAMSLIKKHNISFVVVEKELFYDELFKRKCPYQASFNYEYEVNKNFFTNNFKKVIDNKRYMIFDTKQKPE